MQDRSFTRNRLGDIEMPKMDTEFWQEQRRRWHTYVFNFKHSDGHFHPIDYDGISLVELHHSFPRFNLKEYHLFHLPDNADATYRDFYIRHMHALQSSYIRFFAGLLSDNPAQRREFDISKIVLHEPVYDDILKFINQYELLNIKDFIFLLIASIQKYYINEVEYYQRPEQVLQVKNAKIESQKAIKIIEKYTNKRRVPGNKRPSELQAISFKFNDEIITIKDTVLTSSIIKAYRDYEDRGIYKDWRKQLGAYPRIYNENKFKNMFGHRIAKALNDFFVDSKLFPNSDNRKGAVYEAILHILDFALIPVKDTGQSLHDRAGIIKNWVKRTSLKPTITHLDISPNKDLLKKYFPGNFIDSIGNTVDVNLLSFVVSVCDRFELSSYINEVAHVLGCISHTLTQLRFEYLEIEKQKEKNPDLEAFMDLFKSARLPETEQILNFSFLKDGKVQSFKSRQFICIVNDALSEYFVSHAEEFKIDIWNSEFTQAKDGSWSVVRTSSIKEPYDRFLPKICRQFYDYLLNEIPLSDRDITPSEKYMTMIGLCLEKAGAFSHNMNEERDLKNKVKSWLNLPGASI